MATISIFQGESMSFNVVCPQVPTFTVNWTSTMKVYDSFGTEVVSKSLDKNSGTTAFLAILEPEETILLKKGKYVGRVTISNILDFPYKVAKIGEYDLLVK